MADAETEPQRNLAEMVAAAVARKARARAPAVDIACTSVRIPRAVLRKAAALAEANGMSTSLLLNLLLDAHLRARGQPDYRELAPWYADYAQRRGGLPK